MASFEDYHPNQDPTFYAVMMDLGRMADNVAKLIANWRAMAQASIDPRPNMGAVADSLLGRLFRVYTFFQNNPTELTRIAAKIGMTEQAITDALIARRDSIRTFKNAPKDTIANAKAAVDALALAFPAPNTPSVTPVLLDATLPATW